MSTLSEEGRQTLAGIAQRYGVSLGAVEHLLMAVIAGQTTQAQFNHPDLGGMGQWSQGGMIMIGDMFNNGLKATVANLCSELANLARSSDLMQPVASHQSQSQYQGGGVSLFVPGAFPARNWWPEGLGYAASTGAQNSLRYAFFPASHRLAIDIGGQITVYDTKDHQIGGFSQQQSGDQSLSFTSQYGLVRVSDLDVVPQFDHHPAEASTPQQPEVVAVREPLFAPAPEPAPFVEPLAAPEPPPAQPAPPPAHAPETAAKESDEEIFGKIERLAALHAKGILTDKEFEAKKADLLDRL